MGEGKRYSLASWDSIPDFPPNDLPSNHPWPTRETLTLRAYTIPLQCEQVAVSLCRIGPGQSSLMERAKVAEEIYIIASGRAKILIGEDVVEAKRYDAVRIPADLERSIYNPGTEDCWLIVAAAPIDEFREAYKRTGLW